MRDILAKEVIRRLREEFSWEGWKKMNNLSTNIVTKSQLLKTIYRTYFNKCINFNDCCPSNFLGIFYNLSPPVNFNSAIILIWTKNVTHWRKHLFFDSKRSWIDHFNWEKYLIDNSEVYSEPSLTSRVELFAKIFNNEKLFWGEH